jgi:hypothetical protein
MQVQEGGMHRVFQRCVGGSPNDRQHNLGFSQVRHLRPPMPICDQKQMHLALFHMLVPVLIFEAANHGGVLDLEGLDLGPEGSTKRLGGGSVVGHGEEPPLHSSQPAGLGDCQPIE